MGRQPEGDRPCSSGHPIRGSCCRRGTPSRRRGAGSSLGQRRTDEAIVALDRLDLVGVRRDRLRIGDGEVNGQREQLATAIAKRLEPGSLCVAPWSGDGHPDHDAVGEVAAEVTASAGATLIGYLVWAWHWANPAGSDLPWAACRRLDLSPRQRARKRWATGSFVSQTRVQVAGPGGLAVLPDPVLRRLWQPWEVFVT
ncbi:MAG: PIG-L deacetylase family protein [Acidimicrobiales bacterium]